MKIYNYHYQTGEYVGDSDAPKDPLETKLQGHDVFLVPGNATTVGPPPFGINEVAVYLNGWGVQQDHRATTVWRKSNAREEKIVSIGPIPNDVTNLSPTGVEFPTWNGTTWIPDQIQVAKKAKIKAAKDSLKNTQIGNLNTIGQVCDAIKLILDLFEIEYKH